MKKLAMVAVLVLLVQVVPAPNNNIAVAAIGKWSQANGDITPVFDEFLRTDDTGNTVCAVSPAGDPYVVWQEYTAGNYKICVSTFDGFNWVPPSGDDSYDPKFEVLNPYGSGTDPTVSVFKYYDGSSIQYIPIVFYKKTSGYHEMICSYLTNTGWVTTAFNAYQMLDKPFVTTATDGTILACWSVLDGNNNYQPILMKAEPKLPLVWKYTNGSLVYSPPMPIFSSTASHQQCHVDMFEGTPYLIASMREPSQDSDIAVYKYNGSAWVGLNTVPPTILGDPTYDDKGPRIKLNSSGSPVITWFIDDSASQTGMFAFWNGTSWVSPGDSQPTNLSAKFCAGSKTFEPDLARGTGGTYHIAFNYLDAGEQRLIYTNTDLSKWYKASGDEGQNILNFGLANPSLDVSQLNNPSIAGDRILPGDNPVYTQWSTDFGVVVDWGIEISPQVSEDLNKYDDDGKVVMAGTRTLKLMANIKIPKKLGRGDITIDYTFPKACEFNPGLDAGEFDLPDLYQIDGNTSSWYSYNDASFNDSEWPKIQTIRYVRNNAKDALIKFAITFRGDGLEQTWLINNLNVSISEAQSVTNPAPDYENRIFQKFANIADVPFYSGTHTVSNPIETQEPPSFYIGADRYNGQISTDPNLKALFIIFIYPLGPFYNAVDLSLEIPANSDIGYEFEPITVPRGAGVRKALLRVYGNERTPSGFHKLLVTGKSLKINGSNPVLFSGNASPQYNTSTLNVSVYTLAPKLLLTKRADRVSVSPGSYINYTISIQNVGGASATNVILEDQLPEDVDYISSNPVGSASGKKIVWDVGTVNPLQTIYYTIKVQVKQQQFSAGAAIANVAVAFYNEWLTSAATVFVMVRPTEIPCPQPQAELRFSTEGDGPEAGKPIEGKLYVWDGCNPYSFQLFWGDDTDEVKGDLDKEGFYTLPPHTYQTAGTYLISCHVTDKYGKQNIVRKHIVVH